MWRVEDRQTSGTEYVCTQNIDTQLFPYAINRPAPPFVQGELVAIVPCLEDAENVAHLIAEAPTMYMLLQNIYPIYYVMLLKLMGGHPDEWPQDRTDVLHELETLLAKLKGG